MTDKINDGGPAFPQENDATGSMGMTLREYAAIKLRVPESGTDWLDEMIRKSMRDEFAAKAMQGYLTHEQAANCCSVDLVARWSYEMADAMLRARGNS